MRRALLVVLSLCGAALVGCDTAVAVDFEGNACDPGNVCPTGYACVGGVCHASGGTGGGATGGGTGGGGTGGSGGVCAGVTCNAAPPASCVSGTVMRSYAGACDANTGQCVYTPSDTTCAGGCQAGACVDLCGGVSCVTPPAAKCTSASTLTTYAATGTCVATSGLCTYASTDTTCTNGCQNGACRNQNLCAGVTCATPPATTCAGSAVRTYSASGTCDTGTGQCSYPFTDTACPNGCAAAACIPAALGFSQIGPRLKFQVLAVDNAQGSAGDHVLAVGAGGRVARWNGTAWTELTTPSASSTLHSVAFASGNVAYIVGSNRTAWRYTGGTTPTVTAVGGFPTGGGTGSNLVAVSARALDNVLVADDLGSWFRLAPGTTTWSSGSLSGSNGPYAMTSAWIDEQNVQRLGGACGSAGTSCVASRPSGTNTWTVDKDSDTAGISALGGGFDVPTSTTSVALTGKSSTALASHDQPNHAFATVSPSPALEGGDVFGIAGMSSSTLVRTAVYVLTGSNGSTGTGHLYRLIRGLTSVTSEQLVDTYFGTESLSPTEATGVIVAESKSTGTGSQGVNNVFRRSFLVDEALDLGEDWAGVSANTLGDVFAISAFGDLAIKHPTQATYEFHRGPFFTAKAVEARNGTGVLIAGKDGSGTNAGLQRYLGGSFTTIAVTAPGVTLNSVCRVSDVEGWAVGTGGTIVSINGTAAALAASPTTKDLSSVVCVGVGQAYASGASGVVLTLSGGSWTALTPAFPTTTKTLTDLQVNGGVLYAIGDGVFGKLPQTSGAVWQSLAARAGLHGLIVRGSNEAYALGPDATNPANTAVYRFDGAAWTSLFSTPSSLRGGVQVGARVVYGGTLGAIVDGR